MNILSRATILAGILSIVCLAGVSPLNDSTTHKKAVKQTKECSDIEEIETEFWTNSLRPSIEYVAGQAMQMLEVTLEDLFIEPFKINGELDITREPFPSKVPEVSKGDMAKGYRHRI